MTNVSHPGPEWRMHWLDGGLESLQLDIVGFLAILGEEAVKKTSRLASMSRLLWLPRLLPAPHSLLYTERPEALETVRAKVVSTESGNMTEGMNSVTAALFAGSYLTYSVRCLRIRRPLEPPPGRIRGYDGEPPLVKARIAGPMHLANLFGCILSMALFVCSMAYGDGMSLLATILLSSMSSLVGLSNHWQQERMKHPATTDPGTTYRPGLVDRYLRGVKTTDIEKVAGPSRLPIQPSEERMDSAVVVYFPHGSYLVVKCDENMARELFFGPATIRYTLNSHYMTVCLTGTLLLMLSVIALANAKIQLQLAWAGAFILLNISHWAAAALPRESNFQFPGYEINEELLSTGEHHGNFIAALWSAILFTGTSKWVKQGGFTPNTEVWDAWITAAGLAVKDRQPSPRRARTNNGYASPRTGTWTQERTTQVVYRTDIWNPKAEYERLLQAHEGHS